MTAPIANPGPSARSFRTCQLRRGVLRASVSTALFLAISLPALSADNQGSASLRIHINVVSMVTTSDTAPKLGDLQVPSASEVRVMRNVRSDWSLQPPAKSGKAPNAASVITPELVTTVIVPR